jgi:hypothetical protein
MRKALHTSLFLALVVVGSWGASKPHVIAFGKWNSIKWYIGPEEQQAVDAKARALFVDGKLKEYTLGTPHEITERLFVVRRVLHVNDSLPHESALRWSWQPGGWMLVDRASGHVAQINLPEFDAFASAVSWYRDYAAYCGSAHDHTKVQAYVVQVGRRKPVLKKSVGEVSAQEDSPCPAPEWQRQPIRVTFEPKGTDKLTYSVRSHALEMVKEESDDEGEE